MNAERKCLNAGFPIQAACICGLDGRLQRSPGSALHQQTTQQTNQQTNHKKKYSGKPAKTRVLIEFPTDALLKADALARSRGQSRSEFIRSAVLVQMEQEAVQRFEVELAQACIANRERNPGLIKEYEFVDREAGKMIP